MPADVTPERHSPLHYRTVVELDARRFKLPPIDLDELARPLAYSDELLGPDGGPSAGPRRLSPGRGALETRHLRLVAEVEKLKAATQAGSYQVEHLVLKITNRTNRHLAYRVITPLEPERRCEAQAVLSHNALAIAPGETITRTECLWHRPTSIKVQRVVELGPLSYHYISKLGPSAALYDARTSRGHVGPAREGCRYPPWTERELASDRGADVIDYYARHSCDEYTFFKCYRRRTSPAPLRHARPPGSQTTSDARSLGERILRGKRKGRP